MDDAGFSRGVFRTVRDAFQDLYISECLAVCMVSGSCKLACAIVLVLAVGVFGATPVSAAVFEVDNVDDDAGDNDPGDGSCGVALSVAVIHRCTLRAAIQEANTRPGLDSITRVGDLGNVDPLKAVGTVTVQGGAAAVSNNDQREREKQKPLTEPAVRCAAHAALCGLGLRADRRTEGNRATLLADDFEVSR